MTPCKRAVMACRIYRSGTLHTRHLKIDNRWGILLDRGLDIWQRFDNNDAFSIESRLPEMRCVKAFELTYMRGANSRLHAPSILKERDSVYSYQVPDGFDRRVEQYLAAIVPDTKVLTDLRRCHYDFEDLGNAYYAGIRPSPWDSNAMDVTLLGPSASIGRLREMKTVLNTAVSKALNTSVTGLLLRELFLIEDVAPSSPSFASDQDRFDVDVKNAQIIKEEIVRIGENLSKNSLYTDAISEDSINDFFRDFLDRLDCCEVKDQTRHGLSSNGSAAGEVDILLQKDGREAAIIEGLRLSCVNAVYIGEHIRKATINYNPLGTPVFNLAYVSVNDFDRFWTHCLEFLKGSVRPGLTCRPAG